MRELYLAVSYPLKYLYKSSPIPQQDPFFRHCLQQAQNRSYHHEFITCEILALYFVLQFITYAPGILNHR